MSDDVESQSLAQQVASEAKRKGTKKLLSNPLFWKAVIIGGAVILGVIFVISIVSAFVSIFARDTYDDENGTISSLYGIQGDKFYGARFIYKDDHLANQEMKDTYLEFTYKILTDLNSNITDINIELSADYKTDTLTQNVTTAYANALTEKTNKTIEENVAEITHFGFTDAQITIIIPSIAKTLVSSGIETPEEDIKKELNNLVADQSYAKYKNVCDKLFVYDRLLEDDDAVLEEMPKKNYVAMIYMPKQNVTISSASYRFIVEQGYGANVELKLKNGSSFSSLAPLTNVDFSWYDDGDYELYEADKLNVHLTTFTAINTANLNELENPLSIYSLLGSGLYETYFNAVETGEYTSQNLINNVKTNDYMYLEMSSLDAFNFAEYLVEYE